MHGRKESWLYDLFALCNRSMDRMFGLRGSPGWGENLEARAEAYLLQLAQPLDSLAFKLAVRNLSKELDLFEAEAALLAAPLKLQVALLRLFEEDWVVRGICRYMINEAPVSKLLNAVIGQAYQDGAEVILIEFAREGKRTVEVRFCTAANWLDAMTAPQILNAPFRGAATRMHAAGYAAVKPVVLMDNMPAEATLEWVSENVFEVRLLGGSKGASSIPGTV